MSTEVVMPKLGATMEEGIIVSWMISVGEVIEEGDPIAEIQTDKIVMEIEAEVTGVLLKTLYEAGSTVAVHEVIAYMGEEGEMIAEVLNESSTTSSEGDLEKEEKKLSGSQTDERLRRTPAARKLAETNGIELQHIEGTGPLGRIQKVDVEDYIQKNIKKITPLAKKIAKNNDINYSEIDGSGAYGKVMKDDLIMTNDLESHTNSKADKRVPFKGMRKVIASRISESAFTAPHVTLLSEVDMTNTVKLRQELLPVIENSEALRLSFNDIIFKATAYALVQHPYINVSLDNSDIIYHSNINIGMAVAVPDGLVVPTLRNINQKGLSAITKESKKLAKQAREGKLSPDDMQGSTFTISNLGMYAVDGFTPIINSPNSAILGVGRIQKKSVVVNDELVIRSMMSLSLSFDHRIIDGAPAAAFLTELKDVLENPYKLLV